MKFKITRVPISGENRNRWYLEDETFSKDDCLKGEKIVGEVELDVKPVKKWVKKEIPGQVTCRSYKGENRPENIEYTSLTARNEVPWNARNIKITYEVEE